MGLTQYSLAKNEYGFNAAHRRCLCCEDHVSGTLMYYIIQALSALKVYMLYW